MKKYLLLIFIISILKPQIASAQPLNISLSPAVITVKSQGANEIVSEVEIKNQTDQNVSYTIELIPFKPSPFGNGEPILQSSIDKDYNAVFQNTSIVDNNSPITLVDLSPYQKKSLKIVMGLPGNLPDRDYYFSVVFTSKKAGLENNSTQVAIKQASAVNVLLTYGKKGQPKGEIKEFSVPSYLDKGPVNFRVDVKNNSKNFATTKGNISIKNMFGGIVASFELDSLNILSESERVFDNPSWKQNFLLGFYTAKVEISLSPAGPILTKEVVFFAFPTKFIALSIVILILTVLVYSRLKNSRQ